MSDRTGRPTWAVRTRIMVVITVVAALGMASVGVVVYVVERARILAQVDGRLEAGLESARFIVAEGKAPGQRWESSSEALGGVVTRVSPDDNTGALGLSGAEAVLEPGLRLDVDLRQSPGFAAAVAAESQGRTIIGTYTGDDVQWRYLAAPIAVSGSPEPATVTYVIAYDVEAELAEINEAARAYLIAAAAAIAVIAGTAWFVAARLLRPLRRMRETAARVSAQSLSERLPIEGRDDVSELAATMNDMLDRLDGALESQRSLLSDVGHELKTPLTIVSGYIDVMDADDPADVRSTRTLALDELERMARLVQDLAGAAALHGPAPVAPRPVDAADLVRQIIAKAERIDGATVTAGVVVDVTCDLDPGRITQAMLQLAQNGVTHGGGILQIGSRIRQGSLELWVRDRGPGVPDALKDRVFDRFHRGADPDRPAGSGLGLNIVQVIARAHGGSASVRDALGGGAEFVLALPLPPGVDVDAVPTRTMEPLDAADLAAAETWIFSRDGRNVVVPPRPAPPSSASAPRAPHTKGEGSWPAS